MTSAVGSLPWLLRHELRLTWRFVLDAWSRGKGARRVWIRLSVIAVLLHLCAAPIALGIAMSPWTAKPFDVLLLTGGLAVVWSLMLSQSLHGIIQSVYMRGDLDLLLSSPLPARKVLTVRALAVAVNAVSAWALLFIPLVDMLVVFGQWRWIAAFGVLFSLALTASAAGVGLAMGLFALLGARRTRTVAQIIAVLIGAVAFFLSQLHAFLPADTRKALWAWLQQLANDDTLGAGHGLWLPAHALLGDIAALTICVLGSLVVFVGAIWALGHAFAANATAVAGISTRPAAVAQVGRKLKPFCGGVRTALLVKEWRLLIRDPWLISQMLMQVLYLMPLCFLYWRESYGQHAAIGGVGMMAAVVAGHLAGGLSWITIAGEDASDLLACAPIEPREVLRAKLTAALAPVAAILVPPLVAVAFVSPWGALVAALGCVCAAVCAILLCLWHQKPGKRKAFAQRRKGSTFVNLAELALNFFWGLATAMTINGSLWAMLFVAFALLVMGALAWTRSDTPLLASI